MSDADRRIAEKLWQEWKFLDREEFTADVLATLAEARAEAIAECVRKLRDHPAQTRPTPQQWADWLEEEMKK